MSEATYLDATRTAYDTVAVSYEELLRDELDGKPLDRAMLGAFAELARDVPGGLPVADLGCGPGRVTAHLDRLGVRAFGIDLSPEMIAVARRAHPGLSFDVGSMTALDLADASLAGVLAWYSTVHTPPEVLPAIFAEYHRVLAPGAPVLVAFQAGDQLHHRDRAYGHEVSLDVYWRDPDAVAGLLADAGLAVHARLVRGPEGLELVGRQGRQAFLVARKAR
ncbi:class I SAM-dependent methyltransferase [Actinacidiphila rubida]|uniref:Methyltransferase domain-containing protein n=1 Tax=Actinacidiphila rubida TaxID=310780 RepID=A0A1H8P2N5_9ACTN|nr:class I SAM-dependent methyltransferase [Actinacidiphila rubida]SEO36226.1 Methyltransferase domain-containing protein [Actinacidiphila rubida]